MLVLGYVIQDLTSPGEKFHASFAAGGRYVVRFGPGESGITGGQTRPAPMTVNAAADKVYSLYNEKIAKGYKNLITEGRNGHAIMLFEVPDGTTDERLLDEALKVHTEGRQQDFISSSGAVAFFKSQATGSAPPAAPQAAQNVAQRTQRLSLPDGEVCVRPNGDTYLPRDLGGHTDVAALRAMRTSRLFVLLDGPAGSGKTAVAEAAFGDDLITVVGHGDMTVAHLVGSHQPTPDGGWQWVDGPLTIGMKEGRPVLIDEIIAIPHEAFTVLHPALDGRGMIRLDDRPDEPMVYATEGFYVMGAYNPDTLGGKLLPEAIVSRFPVQITVTTDYDAARALGVPDEFVTIAENLTEKSNQDRNGGGFGVWAPQMRELLATKKLLDNGLGIKFAAAALIKQCPRPEDVTTVAQVMADALGFPIQPLMLGAQV